MASNKETMIKKLGGEQQYIEWLRANAAKPHRRGGKGKLTHQIEVKALEEGVSTDVIVKRLLK